jgi:large repetitive protein
VTGATNYTWTGPNNYSNSPDQNPIIANVTTLAAGTYYVTAKREGQTSTSNSTVVVINPLPTTTAITGTNSVQQLASASYSVANTAGSTYGWTVPAGASFNGGTGNSISVTFGSTSGNVSVIETNSTGCTGSQQSLSVTVITCTAPAIVGGINPGTTNVIAFNPVVFALTNVTGTAPLYYQWRSNNVDIASATNSSYTP